MHVQNLMNSLWDIRIFLGLVPKESPCTFQKWPRWLKLWMYPPRRKWFCKRYKAACRFPLVISSDLYRSNKELHSTVLCVAWDPVSSSDRRFIVQSAMYLFQISCHLLAGLLNLKNQKFCRKLIWKKKSEIHKHNLKCKGSTHTLIAAGCSITCEQRSTS